MRKSATRLSEQPTRSKTRDSFYYCIYFLKKDVKKFFPEVNHFGLRGYQARFRLVKWHDTGSLISVRYEKSSKWKSSKLEAPKDERVPLSMFAVVDRRCG